MCPGAAFPGFKDRNVVLTAVWEVCCHFLDVQIHSAHVVISVFCVPQAAMRVMHPYLEAVFTDGISFEGWGPRVYPECLVLVWDPQQAGCGLSPLYYGSVNGSMFMSGRCSLCL